MLKSEFVTKISEKTGLTKFPAILLVIGIICLLVGKKNDSKVPSLIGVISALVGVVWLVVGTF